VTDLRYSPTYTEDLLTRPYKEALDELRINVQAMKRIVEVDSYTNNDFALLDQRMGLDPPVQNLFQDIWEQQGSQHHTLDV